MDGVNGLTCATRYSTTNRRGPGVFCSGDYSVCECVSLKVDEDEERGDRNCDRKWVMPCLYESSVSVD